MYIRIYVTAQHQCYSIHRHTLRKMTRPFLTVNSLSPVTHVCVSYLGQHWRRRGGGKPFSEPMLDYYEKDHREKILYNLNPNTRTFIQENGFENVVCKMAVILSRPKCVNGYHQLWYQSSYLYIHVCHTYITRHVLSCPPYKLPTNGISCIHVDVKGKTPRYKLNNDFIDVIEIHMHGGISWCQWKYGCLSKSLLRVAW